MRDTIWTRKLKCVRLNGQLGRGQEGGGGIRAKFVRVVVHKDPSKISHHF